MRKLSFGKWKSLRDERLDLFLLKQFQQCNQILSKQCRLQPFERLDTVRNHPLPAGHEPVASNVQSEDSGLTKAMTTARPS